MRSRLILSCVLMLFLFHGTVFAQDLAGMFEQANEAMAKEGPDSAYAQYEALWETYGVESPSLYYNAGIAAVRAGKLGRAIWCFERAKKRNEHAQLRADITFNLNRVRELLRERLRERGAQNQVVFERFPGISERLQQVFSGSVWFGLTAVFGFIAAVLLGWLPQSEAKIARRIGIGALLLFVTFGGLSWIIYQAGPSPQRVVITGTKAVLLEGSHSSANEIPAAIEEGQVLLVIDETHPDFVRVEIPNGTHGWLSRAQIEEI